MIRIAPISAAAALLAGAAGVASAQDGPPSGGPMMMMGWSPGRIDFVAIDTDSNGELSRAELVARATERLAEADGNGDGTISRAELVEAPPRGPGSASTSSARLIVPSPLLWPWRAARWRGPRARRG